MDKKETIWAWKLQEILPTSMNLQSFQIISWNRTTYSQQIKLDSALSSPMFLLCIHRIFLLQSHHFRTFYLLGGIIPFSHKKQQCLHLRDITSKKEADMILQIPKLTGKMIQTAVILFLRIPIWNLIYQETEVLWDKAGNFLQGTAASHHINPKRRCSCSNCFANVSSKKC